MTRKPLAACVILTVAMLAFVTVLGCQPGGGGPKTYKVTGLVTYQGKPVDRANVVFSPVGGPEAGRAGAGMTDAQGRYSADLSPGEYVVLVTKYAQVAGASGAAGGEYTPPEEGAAAPAPKNELPDKYASADKSPLRFKMEAKDSTFNIDLTD